MNTVQRSILRLEPYTIYPFQGPLMASCSLRYPIFRLLLVLLSLSLSCSITASDMSKFTIGRPMQQNRRFVAFRSQSHPPTKSHQISKYNAPCLLAFFSSLQTARHSCPVAPTLRLGAAHGRVVAWATGVGDGLQSEPRRPAFEPHERSHRLPATRRTPGVDGRPRAVG